MISAQHRYEVRFHNKAEWEEISEIELILSLQKYYDHITPAIHKIINGEQVLTPEAVYRIKNDREV